MGKERKKNTSHRRKLIEATVVTSETVLRLRTERERVDAAKATRIANHHAPSRKIASAPTTTPGVIALSGQNQETAGPVTAPTTTTDEAEDLWEEMEGLDVGGDTDSDDGGGLVHDVILVQKRQ